MKRSSLVPPIALDPRQKRPVYGQVYDWFRTAIIEGWMRPGQRIPSTRIMAAELRISRLSVSNAYEQLQAEGYLETFVGSGTCVARTIPDEALVPADAGEKRRSEQVVPSPKRRTVSARGLSLLPVTSEPWLQHRGAFRVTMPALDEFPVKIWSKLVTRHCRTQSRTMMAYGDAMGYLPFRNAITEYLKTYRGVRCEPSQVLVTTGSQQGLQITAHALLDAGDQVLIEDPGYPGARLAFISAGAELVAAPLDDDGMIVPKTNRRRGHAHVAYLTPSHQYPLGMTMSAARRMSILNWANTTGSWIIEDDYDSEYRFDRRPIASLQGMDAHGRVIYIGTFSKILFPALRVGYVVVPKDLVPVFSAVRDAEDIFSSTFYQAVLTDFIHEGHFARYIRHLRMLYLERRENLVNAMRKEIGNDLQVVGSDAGMHLVGLLPPAVDDMKVSEEAARNGISAMPLSICCLKPPVRGGLILGYAGSNPRQINEGVRKLSLIIKKQVRSVS